MNVSRDRNSDRMILAVITLAAAWLRFQYLGQPSLWWDEFITVGASLKPLPDMLSTLMYLGPADYGVELFPPLSHVITHLLLSIGHNDVLMRLPSALAGAATIPAIYFLCRKPLGRLSALTAAALLAVSVYHLHYSREARPYALFMLENVLALNCLLSAMTNGRKKPLIGYGLAVAAMLYTSYMASILVFAQALFALYFLARRFAQGDRREAVSLAWGLGLALALAGTAYMPWARGQMNVFALLHDPAFKPNFSLNFISSTLGEFAAYNYTGAFPTGWTFLILALAGAGAALAGGRSSFVLLMTSWAFMPVAGIFLTKAHMDLSSRYLFPIYIFLAVFTAHALATAVNRLADRLACGQPRIFFARLLAAFPICLFLSGPNLASLEDYYSREPSRYKELAAYLIENMNNQDGVLYSNPRNLKLVFDWYGRSILPDARDIAGSGYHRDCLLTPFPLEASVRLPSAAVERARLHDFDVLSLGIARTPVLPLIPDNQGRAGYSDDFSGFNMLEDVFQAHNLVPSPRAKTLTTLDAGLPAWGVYRFHAGKGRRIRKASLTIAFSIIQNDFIPSDAMVAVSVIAEGGARTSLATVNLDSFRGPDGRLIPADKRKRSITLNLDPTPALKGTDTFDLRLDFAPCTRSGDIEVENLRLDTELDGVPADPAELPEALLAQLPVAPWVPGRELILSDAVHAFSLDGRITLPGVASPNDLSAYLLVHKGDKPVRVLPYGTGAPAVALYDPALAHPFLDLGPEGVRQVDAFPADHREVRSVKLRGALANPVVTVGLTRLILPVTCPAPAELTVAPGGRAELAFSPLFTREGFELSSMSSRDNIRRPDEEDCLTCLSDRPCSLEYTARSGLPVVSARITSFPRVVGDPSGANAVVTQVSADNGPWREVNRYRGSGSGRWEGLKIPQYTRIHLYRPATELRVRFVLSGQAAQLWSAPDARMRLDVSLDAASLPVPSIDAWPSRIGVSQDMPVEILPLADTHPVPDRLRRTR